MIELPEALTIAGQMNEVLKGKRIESCIRGNATHRFAFYSRPPVDYELILKDKLIDDVQYHGSVILASTESDYVLVLGGGGERILFHQCERTIPKTYHLLLCFHDSTYLTVTVQGWGNALLLRKSDLADHPHVGKDKISALNDMFTYDYFYSLLRVLGEEDHRSVKYFIISKPGVCGVGNGYLQDILFRAKIHPKRKAIDLCERECQSLYQSIVSTLRQAADLGGRDSERDLYNRLGRYSRVLGSRQVGQPCPECGTIIRKVQYLGGASYFCPCCQT
ncbi:MAG: zinc finger domain-containing protein [Chloroflexota bacterium]|nr:zinc finger domain-containing protein [Chloroflexota bacterium]